MFDDYSDVPFDVEENRDDPDTLTELYEGDGMVAGPIDMVTANYYVGLVKKQKEKLEDYETEAKRMKEDFAYRVDSWLDTRRKSIEYSIQILMGKLQAYFEANPPAKGKSISLPEGHIGFYTSKQKFDFDTNKEEIIKILEQDESLKKYVRYKAEVNKKDLNKVCEYHDNAVYIGETKLPAGYTPETQEFKTR